MDGLLEKTASQKPGMGLLAVHRWIHAMTLRYSCETIRCVLHWYLSPAGVEAEFLTGQTDIFTAAMGPTEIVLTHKDGLLIYADGNFHEMNFYPARLEGRSGRGDTCLGTYFAKRLSLSPRDAGIWAVAVTSLKMEDVGHFNRSIQ